MDLTVFPAVDAVRERPVGDSHSQRMVMREDCTGWIVSDDVAVHVGVDAPRVV